MVAARANALRKPVRWFSMPQLFRYERQQKGRLREHFQLNVDIVGEPDVTADAELLAVRDRHHARVRAHVERRASRASPTAGCCTALSGVARRARRVGSRRCTRVIDKLEREPRDVLGGEARGARRAGGRRSERDPRDRRRPTSTTLRERVSATCRRHRARRSTRFVRYLEYLDALGVARRGCEFDLSIVRGLAYYTGIVFELFDRKGEFRAICGGGRYDKLLQSLGGVDLPALGFGMGDVVLGELLRARGLMPERDADLDYWVACGRRGVAGDAMRIATLCARTGGSRSSTR